MEIQLNDEQRHALANAGDSPVDVVDPQTNVAYVLIRADLFARIRSIFASEDFAISDAYPLMDAVARAAGWDDPAEDIYNDLDPRRQE